jgi:hypothetical protein
MFLSKTILSPSHACEPNMHHAAKRMFIFTLLLSTSAMHGQAAPSTSAKEAPVWSITATGGFTSTFQMVLGSTFGPGNDLQDKLTAGIGNAFVKHDNLSVFGWSTIDLSIIVPNWQAGVLYKAPLLYRRNQSLFLTGGVQRWLLPLVKTGSRDWLATGNLTYATAVKRIPVFVSEDSYSLLKSNLPTGSGLYSQIYTQHVLLNRHGVNLTLREGPAYTYSWGFYGCNGNRVFRYGASLLTSWKGTTLEAMYRKQIGLQDNIPHNDYWSFLFSRQFSGAFHLR